VSGTVGSTSATGEAPAVPSAAEPAVSTTAASTASAATVGAALASPATDEIAEIQWSNPPNATRTHRWARQYTLALLITDLGAVLVATSVGYFLRFGTDRSTENQITYLIVGAAIVATWLFALTGVAAYEIRHMTSGAEEFKRVIRGTLWTFGLVGVACYLLGVTVARGFVAVVFPLGLVLLVAMRYVLRRLVSSMRREGMWVYRIVVIGNPDSALGLVRATVNAKMSGLRVVGACVPDPEPGTEIAPGVPVLGGLRDAARAADRIDADVVAVAGTELGPRGVRELGWELEGTGRGLIMAPGLTEVAGPRVHVSPVEGLPLMWVEQPQFTGLSRLVKRMVDVVGALAVLVLSSPVLLATAIAVKATSPGPVLFKQSRLGTNGTEFRVWKFRSMYIDAEARRDELWDQNEQDGDGVLFKITNDPRITRVGRIIRALSIDELPQLVNVLRGQMSLVGPRPLATVDSTYTGHARRRLLVRPGMTGLWQVSGRSDTSWEDAVRLDLYYVENWSLAFDVSIILRTVWAVLKRSGAY
jgi:exopolysaccharide biosynthesis polyprenyl glycosylphosphotransferase